MNFATVSKDIIICNFDRIHPNSSEKILELIHEYYESKNHDLNFIILLNSNFNSFLYDPIGIVSSTSCRSFCPKRKIEIDNLYSPFSSCERLERKAFIPWMLDYKRYNPKKKELIERLIVLDDDYIKMTEAIYTGKMIINILSSSRLKNDILDRMITEILSITSRKHGTPTGGIGKISGSQNIFYNPERFQLYLKSLKTIPESFRASSTIIRNPEFHDIESRFIRIPKHKKTLEINFKEKKILINTIEILKNSGLAEVKKINGKYSFIFYPEFLLEILTNLNLEYNMPVHFPYR